MRVGLVTVLLCTVSLAEVATVSCRMKWPWSVTWVTELAEVVMISYIEIKLLMVFMVSHSG